MALLLPTQPEHRKPPDPSQRGIDQRPQRLFSAEALENVVWYSAGANTWLGISGQYAPSFEPAQSILKPSKPFFPIFVLAQEAHRRTPLRLSLWKTVLATR